jgi:hypothetical protein
MASRARTCRFLSRTARGLLLAAPSVQCGARTDCLSSLWLFSCACSQKLGDGGSCTRVLPSDYDQSCAVDSDCILVAAASSCPGDVWFGCGQGTINADVAGSYMVAAAQTNAASPPSGIGCACVNGPAFAACRSGQCFAVPISAWESDRLPACIDADGYCVGPASAGCANFMSGSVEGAPDACAYADEVCCVQPGTAVKLINAGPGDDGGVDSGPEDDGAGDRAQ